MTDRIVLDASAVVAVIAEETIRPGLLKRVVQAEAYAPELIMLEVIQTLRRRVRRQELSPDIAEGAVNQLADLPVIHVPHRPFIRRIWELRHSVTAYDAAYVALAEELDVPIVTADAKLSRSNGHKASIEVYSAN